jgi:antitoxin MazE
MMRITIRRIGNSKGMIIPTAMLAQLGLDKEAEITVEDGALVIRPPAKRPREGWAEASVSLAAAGDDALVLPEFSNSEDGALSW